MILLFMVKVKKDLSVRSVCLLEILHLDHGHFVKDNCCRFLSIQHSFRFLELLVSFQFVFFNSQRVELGQGLGIRRGLGLELRIGLPSMGAKNPNFFFSEF